MPEFNFNPALPKPIPYQNGTLVDDRFNEGQQVLSLTIPVDSVTHLIDHLQNLVNTKAKEGEVYDFAKERREQLKLNVYKSSLKSMDGDIRSIMGNINPQKIRYRSR